MKNKQLIDHLNTIAQLKSINGDSRFAVAAFQHAAHQISMLADDIETVDYTQISGIGKGISYDIKQFLDTGMSDRYKDLASLYPVEALTMTAVDGIGPKRAIVLHQKGYRNFNDLLNAARQNKLDQKLQEAVLLAGMKVQGRIPYDVAIKLANKIKSQLLEVEDIEAIEIAGSVRRKTESSKDIDIAVCVSNGEIRDAVFDKFRSLGTGFIGGDTKASVKVLTSLTGDGRQNVGVQVDLWVGGPVSWGALLNHCTGSRDHNIRMRKLAQEKALKVNEYGIFSEVGIKLGGARETDLFDVLGIPYVEPEDRK